MIVTINDGSSHPKIVHIYQHDLAKELRVSAQYIGMCLKGKRQLNQRQARRLERKFGIPTTIWPRLAA